MKFLRYLGFLILFLMLSAKAYSQSEYGEEKIRYSRFFHSCGFSLFTEYVSGPMSSVPFYDTTGVNVVKFDPERFSVYDNNSWNALSFTYIIRYVFWRIDNDHSLSLAMPINLGLSYIKANDGSGAYGSLSVPLMIQYISSGLGDFSGLNCSELTTGKILKSAPAPTIQPFQTSVSKVDATPELY